MEHEKDFQARVLGIGGLLHELETIVDPAARATARQLVQLLMELHGAALERMLEIVFDSGAAGQPLIETLGEDPLVSSLLVLYGLHPHDLSTRVERKLHQLRAPLNKMGARAELIELAGADVRVHAVVEGHACGSTAASVQSLLERELFECAPDINSLVIEGLEKPAASGFVALDTLVAPPPVPALAQGGEGMD